MCLFLKQNEMPNVAEEVSGAVMGVAAPAMDVAHVAREQGDKRSPCKLLPHGKAMRDYNRQHEMPPKQIKLA